MPARGIARLVGIKTTLTDAFVGVVKHLLIKG
jgi:hypothetical protein